jgi:hypothetical protein
MSEFDTSRRRALVRDLLAGLRGQPVDLPPFETVRERLRLRHLVDRGLQEVPLDRILGSVGRAREFNWPVAWPQAIDTWRRRVYRPVIDGLLASGVLKLFPRRTETDLYLWLVDHLGRLRGLYGDRSLAHDGRAGNAATARRRPVPGSLPPTAIWG